jgi:hypothetical protein
VKLQQTINKTDNRTRQSDYYARKQYSVVRAAHEALPQDLGRRVCLLVDAAEQLTESGRQADVTDYEAWKQHPKVRQAYKGLSEDLRRRLWGCLLSVQRKEKRAAARKQGRRAQR